MGGSHSWRQQITGADWMRDVEKRILHEERRPQISSASDLLGPGIGAFSVPISDWNAPETAFNGYFHSTPGALNSPDPLRYWMGTSQASQDGYGIERVVEYWGNPISAVTNRVYMRRFYTLLDGTRTYTLWSLEDGPDTGWLDMTNWASGWIPAGGAGGAAMWQARQIGNQVFLRGNTKNDTFVGNNTTVCSLDPKITPPLQTTGFVVVGSSQPKWGNVLANSTITVTAAAATAGSWMQIVGGYLTD